MHSARQREAMRLAARNESKAAEANSEAKGAGGKEWEANSEAKSVGGKEPAANSEAKSAGGKEWEAEFLFFYCCHTPLFSTSIFLSDVDEIWYGG